MKNLCILISFFALLLCLPGCLSDSSSDIGIFVDPYNHDGQSVFPVEKQTFDIVQKMAVTTGAEIPSIFDDGFSPIVKDGHFEAREFWFFVPLEWRNNFAVEASSSSLMSYDVRTVRFYYVEPQTGLRAELLRIEAAASDYQTMVTTGTKQKIGESSDGSMVFYSVAVRDAIPNGFLSKDDYVQIFEALMTDNCKINITA
ncbi:MAG: hypothetical protein RR058_05830 [Oscillospiraceae bacterium]